MDNFLLIVAAAKRAMMIVSLFSPPCSFTEAIWTLISFTNWTWSFIFAAFPFRRVMGRRSFAGHVGSLWDSSAPLTIACEGRVLDVLAQQSPGNRLPRLARLHCVCHDRRSWFWGIRRYLSDLQSERSCCIYRWTWKDFATATPSWYRPKNCEPFRLPSDRRPFHQHRSLLCAFRWLDASHNFDAVFKVWHLVSSASDDWRDYSGLNSIRYEMRSSFSTHRALRSWSTHSEAIN